MKQVAEECHRLLHSNNSSHLPVRFRYHLHEINPLEFGKVSGSLNDIVRIDYGVQECRLNSNPFCANWNRQEFDHFLESISNHPIINHVHIPCMFTNHWNRHWNIDKYYDSLRRSTADTALTVKVGHGDDGLQMEWNQFIEYLENDCLGHNDPLYVIDDDFHLKLPEFSQTYCIPAPFAWTIEHDVFAHVPDAHRPPYRWFVLGGWRSGSPLHTDPYCSNAWNVSIRGRKRWIVFPGRCLKKEESHCDESLRRILCGDLEWKGLYSPQPVLEWFEEQYPLLIEYRNGSNKVESDSKKDIFDDFYEFIQEPGDMVYVPSGWAHAVLNLEETVAVTHNFTLKDHEVKVMNRWREEM